MDGNGVSVNWINMCADMVSLGISTEQQAQMVSTVLAGQNGWTKELSSIYLVSGTTFSVDTNKTSLYKTGRAISVIQTSSAIGYIKSSSYDAGTNKTTVTCQNITLDSGFNEVWFGQDISNASLHASQHALSGIDSLASVLASMPAHFSRSAPLAAKTVTNSWDRYALIPWPEFGVNLWSAGLYKAGAPEMYLDNAAWWDSIVTTDYTVAANRAGKDFYVYACNIGVVAPKIVLSPNATIPVGYTAGNSRLLGGFHCLCANVGAISGHALTGYLAGDILPASVWDQLRRPISSPAGMVYASGIGKWIDIYLPSLSGGALASVYHGTIADGAGATAFDWYMFAEFFGRIGKRMLTQSEFMAASVSAAGWASVAGAADPIITGGHLDSNGVRIISGIGCEDIYGTMWQWINETAGQYETSVDYLSQQTSGSWLSGYALSVPRRGLVGGDYSSGNKSGALCARWETWPSYCGASMTSRGLSDPI